MASRLLGGEHFALEIVHVLELGRRKDERRNPASRNRGRNCRTQSQTNWDMVAEVAVEMLADCPEWIHRS